MSSGIDVNSEIEEISLVRKNISGLIDAAIIVALFLFIAFLIPIEVLTKLQRPIANEVYILLLLVIYRLLSLIIFNGTFGMQICRIQILNHELKNLSSKEKLCASFFVLINGVSYYKKG